MRLTKCDSSDLPLLARWNRQLIEDEGSDNPMSVPELEKRMNDFLSNGYAAYLFWEGEKPVGYALIDLTGTPYYLRQFFIARDSRRKRFGKAAFALLLRELDCKSIDIDVLTGNENGQAFWESLGFRETWRHMRLHIT